MLRPEVKICDVKLYQNGRYDKDFPRVTAEEK